MSAKESDILYETNQGTCYISNEGSKKSPKYHVWVNGATCAMADSAYADLSLAIARADYIDQSKNN